MRANRGAETVAFFFFAGFPEQHPEAIIKRRQPARGVVLPVYTACDGAYDLVDARFSAPASRVTSTQASSQDAYA